MFLNNSTITMHFWSSPSMLNPAIKYDSAFSNVLQPSRIPRFYSLIIKYRANELHFQWTLQNDYKWHRSNAYFTIVWYASTKFQYDVLVDYTICQYIAKDLNGTPFWEICRITWKSVSDCYTYRNDSFYYFSTHFNCHFADGICL